MYIIILIQFMHRFYKYTYIELFIQVYMLYLILYGYNSTCTYVEHSKNNETFLAKNA